MIKCLKEKLNMSETKHTPPFHQEKVITFKSVHPFTDSFSSESAQVILDEPTMIDLNLLKEQEKLTLLRELEKRQTYADDVKISWTKDHADLLLKLRKQLGENE